MPVTAGKNIALGPAAQDLGLGDLLQQQLADQEAERKKKMLQGQMSQQRGLGNGMNGLAAQSLLGTAVNG